MIWFGFPMRFSQCPRKSLCFTGQRSIRWAESACGRIEVEWIRWFDLKRNARRPESLCLVPDNKRTAREWRKLAASGEVASDWNAVGESLVESEENCG